MKRFLVFVLAAGAVGLLLRKFAGNLPGLGGGPIGPAPVGPVGGPGWPGPVDPDDR